MATGSLTFSPSNWNVTQTITLNSVDEVLLDGSQQSSITVAVNTASDADFTSLPTQTVTVTTLDDDLPGFSVSGVSGSLQEGSSGTASFTVVLDVQPLTDVVLTIQNFDGSELQVSSASSLTFSNSSWNVSQTVRLSSVDEYYIDGSQTVSLSIAVDPSSNAGFIGLASQTLSTVVLDDDIAGVTVSILDNLTGEDGDTASFTLVLDAIPTSDVTILLNATPTAEITTLSSVTFTSSNWNIPQSVIVQGVNDAPPLSDGSQTATVVTLDVQSLDANFNVLSDNDIIDVPVTNQDDDAPGVVISTVDNLFYTTEAGGEVIVQFSLLAQPVGGASVVIPLSLSGAAGEAQMTATQIEISAANWNQPTNNQVLITGLDDVIIDGNQSYRLITGDPSSADPIQDGMTATDVANINLFNQDNDRAGISIRYPESVSESGTTTVMGVQLETQITGPVELVLSVSDSSELSLSRTTLLFDPTNWNQEQTVQVIGLDDTLLDGNILSSVLIQVSSSQCATNYCTLGIISIDVMNFDNDSDLDGDGVFDAFDNCISEVNPDQSDIDGDGIGDVCDQDRDGDGVLDVQEIIDGTAVANPCSFVFSNITGPIHSLADCDSDGVLDRFDEDDDNDGLLDSQEGFVDFDGDGIPNTLDLDSDGDGCLDVLEGGFSDQDSDGVLGQAPIAVSPTGRVVGQGGYRDALDNDSDGQSDFLQVSIPLEWTKQPPSNTELLDTAFSIEVGVNNSEDVAYQWQIKPPNAIDDMWENLEEDTVFSGTQSDILTISNATETLEGSQLRVVAYSLSNVCMPPIVSSVTNLVITAIDIPNAFSPDGDGINDVWEIRGLNFQRNYTLTVFNRWEVKVFESSNYNNDWDGTSVLGGWTAGNQQLPEGTYFYFLQLEDQPPLTGFVYIKRRNP